MKADANEDERDEDEDLEDEDDDDPGEWFEAEERRAEEGGEEGDDDEPRDDETDHAPEDAEQREERRGTVVVGSFPSSAAAELVRGRLRSAGIPSALLNENAGTWMAGRWGNAVAIQVAVLASQAEEARALLGDAVPVAAPPRDLRTRRLDLAWNVTLISVVFPPLVIAAILILCVAYGETPEPWTKEQIRRVKITLRIAAYVAAFGAMIAYQLLRG